MKPEDFVIVPVNHKIIHYHHIESGKKREEILTKRMTGKMIQSEFDLEQKKMRGGEYLKYIYSERDYLKAIGNL